VAATVLLGRTAPARPRESQQELDAKRHRNGASGNKRRQPALVDEDECLGRRQLQAARFGNSAFGDQRLRVASIAVWLMRPTPRSIQAAWHGTSRVHQVYGACPRFRPSVEDRPI
jgi:hypothetical protein